ncbi:hypothetical protein [Synechococcus elongatus]|uniref:hypothetical protein n=1 Tax=Synechococcus elongatus TaxID=32046 RepID=UPI0030D32B87
MPIIQRALKRPRSRLQQRYWWRRIPLLAKIGSFLLNQTVLILSQALQPLPSRRAINLQTVGLNNTHIESDGTLLKLTPKYDANNQRVLAWLP